MYPVGERVLTCPPQPGFVPKNGQNLTALGILGYWQLQGRNCRSRQECRTELFGTHSLLEILWEDGVRRERNEAFQVKQGWAGGFSRTVVKLFLSNGKIWTQVHIQETQRCVLQAKKNIHRTEPSLKALRDTNGHFIELLLPWLWGNISVV